MTIGTRRIGSLALAAAIGIAAVALVLGTRSGGEATTTAPTEAAEPPEAPDATAMLVARGFLEAYGAFDFDEAVVYLADDADITQLVTSVGDHGLAGTLDDLRLLLSLLEAQGYEQMLRPCDELGRSPAGTRLLCPFDFHAIRSREIGKGPFSGSYFLLTVRDGTIVHASKTFAVDEFSPQIWEPFADWVNHAHPQDAAIMYTDSGARISEGSIRRWGKRTREYVRLKTPRTVEVAQRFMEARDRHDAEKAMSMLADEGATVRLLFDNALYRNMPSLRMNRRQLALALEAERIYRARYRSVACRREPVLGSEGRAQILCSYRLDNRLRHIAGYGPKTSELGIGVHNGRVDYLSFPWLNFSFPSWLPNESAGFVEWLEAEHPEAGGAMRRGELFRTMGQELVLIVRPTSLDLLSHYLDEYERATEG